MVKFEHNFVENVNGTSATQGVLKPVVEIGRKGRRKKHERACNAWRNSCSISPMDFLTFPSMLQ
jgi:hypothetical protein